MFVQDNLLGISDRLSAKSILSDKTGSILGILGTIGFIVASIVIFIGPIVGYFNGDYIQGIFDVNQFEQQQIYSGCSFKLAVFFHSRATGQLLNHTQIKNYFDLKTIYLYSSSSVYYSSVEQCNNEYFAEMENNQYVYKPEDCFIVPDQLGFLSYGTTAFFGFSFSPSCIDPFSCTPTSGAQYTARIIQFLKSNYYVLKFTSDVIKESGEKERKFFSVYSTQWQGKNTTISTMSAIFLTQKMYLDDSIMPWFNNDTKFFSTWNGLSYGYNPNKQEISTTGFNTYITFTSLKNVYYRQYKKLDWLLGMIGGGIFFLYLIFWAVCSYLTTIKQKMQNTKSILMLVNKNNEDKQISLMKPNFRILWYPFSILPFNLKCFQRENKMIQKSEEYMDIAQLIKKLKVAIKNVKINNLQPKFSPRMLLMTNANNSDFTNEELKYQLSLPVIQSIKTQQSIPHIYKNNLFMLALRSQQKQLNDENNKKINQLLSQDIYSKQKKSQFTDKQNRGCSSKLCSKLCNFLTKIFEFFDFFGAKPNFTGNPHNYSCFSCSICILIFILSILTFCLTIRNMNITRTYWDQVYLEQQNQSFKLKTGKQFRAVICFHPLPIYSGLINSQNRIADIKFYQYKRDGKTEKYLYFQTIPADNDGSYYDVGEQDIKLYLCFKPNDGTVVQIYGNQKTEKQAYVGFKLIPYCSNTLSYCNSNQNQTNANFFLLLNVFPIWFKLPSPNYYPDTDQILIRPYQMVFSQTVTQYDLSFNQSIQQTISLNGLNVIDDRKNWITGNAQSNKTKYLGVQKKLQNSVLKTVQSTIPYYKLKINYSGKTQRVIFSNYKIDFLFAIIGGCFAFYYFFFACIGKVYNNYKLKAKLAEQLYEQDPQEISGFKYILKWLRIPYCKEPVLAKIEQDLNSVRLAKNITNVYRLSVAEYQQALYRDIALLYLKQKIYTTQQIQVQVKKQVDQEGNDDDDDFVDQYQRAILQKKGKNKNKNRIQNVSQSENQQNSQINQEYTKINQQRQPIAEENPSVKQTQKCGTFLNNYNIFHNNAQLTLNGKRTIKSVCGGIYCLCLLAFVCVLTSHFWSLYFSGWYRISQSIVVGQNSQINRMKFQVGKDFKLAVSFNKIDNYKIQNVNSYIRNVGISIIKYKVEKNSGHFLQTQLQKIDLQYCNQNYFNNFTTGNYLKNDDFYNNLDKALCVPDGIVLNLYGNINDDVRQYFSLKIYNKDVGNSTSQAAIKYLLQNYIPVYHISSPIIDYSEGQKQTLIYSTKQFVKSKYYQFDVSRKYNITVTKNIIQYDTAVNPNNQKPTLESYQFQTKGKHQFSDDAYSLTDIQNQLTFAYQQKYNIYTIKTIKINQVFAMIGGCIALIFVGLGCIPRSYNQFKMRHLIGSKLYLIVRKNQTKHKISSKSKIKKQTEQPKSKYERVPQPSEMKLIFAWLVSFWAYFKKDYNDNKYVKDCFLIQSRVGKDINIFQIMKNLYMCQDIIRKKQFAIKSGLDLCRIYCKQLITNRENYEANRQLMSQMVNNYPQLFNVAKLNNFSIWQINKIIEARKKSLTNLDKILKQRWLDSFYSIRRQKTTNSSVMDLSQASYIQKAKSQLSDKSQIKLLQTQTMNNNQKSEKNAKLWIQESMKEKSIKNQKQRQRQIDIESHYQNRSVKSVKGVRKQIFQQIQPLEFLDV